ncbi:hypothetical protein CVT26_012272 [Gymnopilus dilepis]|uniref:Uncharacterized protein n=1 Tax=Gymnopilus dilepis TaxID=231916 RepID=A0A409YQB3_9AGAR|nr:hypothetical protein CVT26_012272 [Gymnopilus dilepis]
MRQCVLPLPTSFRWTKQRSRVANVYTCGHVIPEPEEYIACANPRCKFSPVHPTTCVNPQCRQTCLQYKGAPEQYCESWHCPPGKTAEIVHQLLISKGHAQVVSQQDVEQRSRFHSPNHALLYAFLLSLYAI